MNERRRQVAAEIAAGEKPWEKLPSWPHMSDSARRYVRAVMEKDKKALQGIYINAFKNLRDNWSDELPEEDVRNLATLDEQGRFVGDKYKCRGNFLFALKSEIVGAKRDELLTDMDQDTQDVLDRLSAHKFDFTRRTTREEIDLMNKTLNVLIAFLEAHRV
jgi:hypothetical protein